MYSSAKAKQERCFFQSELRKYCRESGCVEPDFPVTCTGLGATLDFSPGND